MKLIYSSSAEYVANRVVFGTARTRFEQPGTVRTTATVRALAARALAARARRKGISGEDWAERFIQNTHDEE